MKKILLILITITYFTSTLIIVSYATSDPHDVSHLTGKWVKLTRVKNGQLHPFGTGSEADYRLLETTGRWYIVESGGQYIIASTQPVRNWLWNGSNWYHGSLFNAGTQYEITFTNEHNKLTLIQSNDDLYDLAGSTQYYNRDDDSIEFTFPKQSFKYDFIPTNVAFWARGFNDDRWTNDYYLRFYVYENGNWRQYFKSQLMPFFNTSENRAGSDHVLFVPGRLKIEFYTRNKLFQTVEFEIENIKQKEVLEIKGFSDGQRGPYPPVTTVLKTNYLKEIDVYINETFIKSFGKEDVVHTFVVRSNHVLLGDNYIRIYERGTSNLLQERRFVIEASEDGRSPYEKIYDEIGGGSSRPDAPERPTSYNPVDWIVYIIDSIAYYTKILASGVGSIVHGMLTMINPIASMFQVAFSFLPKEINILIGAILILGFFLRIVNR
jgi:hypothetical protein